MVISVVKLKGGIGASQVALLLFHSLRQAGRSVGLRDWDSQGTSTQSLRLTAPEPQPAKPEILIWDTPPSLTHTATETAIRASDLILCLATPSPADVWEVGKAIQHSLKYKRPQAQVRVVWNKVKPKTILGRVIGETAKQFDVPALGPTLSYRESYQHFLWQGWGALDRVAREEVLNLTIAILGTVAA